MRLRMAMPLPARRSVLPPRARSTRSRTLGRSVWEPGSASSLSRDSLSPPGLESRRAFLLRGFRHMVRKRSILALALGIAASLTLEAPAWRGGGGGRAAGAGGGEGREGGEKRGKEHPLRGAVAPPRWSGRGPDLKTDKKGK